MCVCPSEDDCPWKVDLICGSDGQSYLNECVMRARACKAGKNVTRVRKGYCGEYPDISQINNMNFKKPRRQRQRKRRLKI